MAEYKYNKKHNSTHQIILEEVAPDLMVLDVGCGPGYLGKELSKKGCKLFGIEINPSYISEAKPYYKQIIQCNLDTISELPFTKESFDCILFADVVEHLKYPEESIRSLLDFLKPGGIVIISVPNVANFTIRLKLLFGNFDYAESGIMDRTHLHFFTLKSIKKFAVDLGLSINKIRYGSDHFGRVINLIKNLRGLLSYQFIIIGAKCGE